jgi:hypothetical protein
MTDHNDDASEVSPTPVYRDGHLYVSESMCPTCIFRGGNLMRLQPGRVKGMVDDCLSPESEGAGNIPCHETLSGEQAICRGFWNAYKDRVQLLTVADRMGIVREQPVPEGWL